MTERRPETGPGEGAGPGRFVRPAPSLASIVVPVYNEADNIEPLAEAVAEAMGDRPYELIYVDDGSADETFGRVEALADRDDRVVGVSLSRNFGHQYALAAGLRESRGEVVITMDGDLQHPPSLIPELLDRWRMGYNIVQTQRKDTEETPAAKRGTSRAFYRVFSWLCGVRLDPGMADFRLLDRGIVDELCAMREDRLFLRGLVAWMGYRKAVVPFTVRSRHAGRSKYTLRKMLRFGASGLFAFSAVPLRLAILLGLITAGLSVVEIVYALAVWASGRALPGWSSTIIVQSFLFAVVFVLLGIQGEYILRIYQRVQGRPRFLVERTIRGQKPRPGASDAPEPDA